MDPAWWIALLLLSAIALLVAELLLPTYGVLALAAGALALAAVVVSFAQSAYLGLAVLLAVVLLTPLLLKLWLDYSPHLPIGRRLFLPPTRTVQPPSRVELGDTGTALSEMRPWGECEFGAVRVESVSELGIITAGTRVKVVAVNDGKPTVRAIAPGAGRPS